MVTTTITIAAVAVAVVVKADLLPSSIISTRTTTTPLSPAGSMTDTLRGTSSTMTLLINIRTAIMTDRIVVDKVSISLTEMIEITRMVAVAAILDCKMVTCPINREDVVKMMVTNNNTTAGSSLTTMTTTITKRAVGITTHARCPSSSNLTVAIVRSTMQIRATTAASRVVVAVVNARVATPTRTTGELPNKSPIVDKTKASTRRRRTKTTRATVRVVVVEEAVAAPSPSLEVQTGVVTTRLQFNKKPMVQIMTRTDLSSRSATLTPGSTKLSPTWAGAKVVLVEDVNILKLVITPVRTTAGSPGTTSAALPPLMPLMK